MKNKLYLLSVILITGIALLSFRKNDGGDIQLSNLRCEMLQNPEGIDVVKPRLNWEISGKERGIEQTAYQIIVASTPEKLKANEGDLWNSGKINSNQSALVSYEGQALKSRTDCYWKVKIWTKDGESSWSQPAHWSMGLLAASDWKGSWIGLDRGFPWDSISRLSRLSSRYFRKDFDLSKSIKKAKISIAGLGLYELYINGQRIGDQVLAPCPTDYRKTVRYNSFDVTSNLQKGKNAIGTILGNGRFFNMRQNFKPWKITTFGFPKMLLQLDIEYTDETRQSIVSDQSWKVTSDGPIRTANEYDGEEYDANKEFQGWNKVGFNDSQWLQPELVKEPGGILKAQMNENMKIMEVISPKSIKQLKPGTWILDMGQNMAGWLQLNVKGKKGDKVTMRFAESLQPDGSLYMANLREAQVTDVYTLKGDGRETWEPRFVYHGFRYVEITGYPGTPTINDFKGKVVYDEMNTIGSFESSNQTLNQIHKNAYWGIRSNYKGMPVDCPQRDERQPWLADHAVGSLGESFIFDNARLYTKWLDDIEDSQTEEGSIPDVVPCYIKYYRDNITWPSTYLIIADMLYTQYGDKEPIIKHYNSMKKWIDYMRTKYMKDYLITKDNLGDWCVPPESKELIHSKDPARQTDLVLIGTAYYYHMAELMQRFAGIVNKPQDAKEYADMNIKIKDAFNAKFLNIKKRQYSNNTVTANLLPLYFGITPDSLKSGVFGSISEKTIREQNGHISTGLIGAQWLMRGLCQFGRPDIAWHMATKRDYPGWGYMVEKGATTIWELWNGNTADPKMNSQNHVMLLGDLCVWYYENLAGIKSDDVETGFKKIIMNPSVIDGLYDVKASYKSMYGTIRSEYKSETQRFSWKITVPGNTKAVVYIPAYSEDAVTESGGKASTSRGVKFLRMEGKTAVFEIGSGDYSFVSTYPWKDGIVTNEFIFDHASYPECHASTIAETPYGLVAAWFGGTKEANPDCCIWFSRNINGKWEAPQQVADGIITDTSRLACWNPVLYQIPGGDLLLFYKKGKKVAFWKGYLISSKDGGLTWSKPTELPEGFLGPIKNKPVLLKTGELMCPSSTEGSGWKVHFEVTPDFGKTWTKIGPINDGKTMNAIQPSILFHKDGKLQILCRSRNRAILESWSSDNGKTWNPMAATSLPNNNSGTDAVTLADGRQLLVYNHVLPPDGLAKGARTPLNVAISDDGKTWYAVLVLEDSPISQYSYPSVIQSKDGLVHFIYTWRRQRIKHIAVDPKLLKPVKIENGLWPGQKPGDNSQKASNEE